MKQAIIIHPTDNVAVLLEDCAKGEAASIASGQELCATADIPAGHKIALREIACGEDIIKYGFPIGNATTAIAAGDYVHTHNLKTGLSPDLNLTYTPSFSELPQEPAETFNGYLRANGEAGVRNEIWIIPTVGCVNQLARNIARRADFPEDESIDGVYAWEHPFGCSQLGDDHLTTQKILAGLARNPNAGGVLILGLGCENNHIEEFKKVLGDCDPQRVRFINAQDYEDEEEECLNTIASLADLMRNDKRQPLPCSLLKVGLKCGGSDAFSGITANPLLGRFSDMLVSCGGTTALTEIPEMFGAEGIILNRCHNQDVFKDALDMILKFRHYYESHGEPVSENPSPGNKKGGISSLEDKSLGCVQKGGTSPVKQIAGYGQRLTGAGLAIVEGPGNDMVAVTNLAAAGCQIILFTTGRGTPLGGPVPTVKVASNTTLAQKKNNWIDFDAGKLLDNQKSNDVANEFFSFILAIANGEKTRNEKNNYREISIFKSGVTL